MSISSIFTGNILEFGLSQIRVLPRTVNLAWASEVIMCSDPYFTVTKK
jgi:hypothetical protein